MAHVRKVRVIKRPPGYSDQQDERQTLKHTVEKMTAEALLSGEMDFTCGDELYVYCDGKFKAWCLADPTRIGKEIGEQ